MLTDNDKAIRDTIDFWLERTGTRISRESAREIVENVSGFFRMLSEWDQHATETKTEPPPGAADEMSF